MELKTILIATDFSAVSLNAIAYGAALAKCINAKVVLFHCFNLPITTSEVMLMPSSIEEIESLALSQLEKQRNELLQKNGSSINIEIICKCGFVTEVLNEYTNTHKVDLLIFGMHGGGYLEEKLMGSVTTAVMKNNKLPLLIVSKDISFETFKTIVIASDNHPLAKKESISPMIELAKQFQSHVKIVNVVEKGDNTSNIDHVVSNIELKKSLDGIVYSFHQHISSDIANGLNEFSIQEKGNLIVMIAHKHSWFSNLIHESNTKHMAFHTHLPLLVLHD